MARKTRIDLLGATLLLAIMLSLGLNQVAVKFVNDGMAPLFQAAMRSLCAAPIMFVYAVLIRRKSLGIGAGVLLPGIICGICFSAEFVLLFQALEYTSVARASIFFYTMPFWVAVSAHFLIEGEQLTTLKITGLILAGIGVAVALAGKHQALGPEAWLGDLMSLVAASLWAAIAVIARTTRFSSASPEVQLLYQLVVSAMILVPIALLWGETFRDPQISHWVVFSLQVVVVVCIGFATWFWVLSNYPASDMTSFSFLAPLFGVLFGWLLLDEPLTWAIAIALLLVATGIVLVNRKPA